MLQRFVVFVSAFVVLVWAYAGFADHPPAQVDLPGGGKVNCTWTPKMEKAERELVNTPLFSLEPMIYPGNVLSPTAYANGQAIPVVPALDIPKPTLSIDGLRFKEEDASYVVSLPSANASEVVNGIQKLLHQPLKPGGQMATVSYRLEPIDNLEQLAYVSGIDKRFLRGGISALGIDSKSANGHVLLAYTQTLYTIGVDPFAPKPGDAGYLVSDVSYGYRVLLVFSSPFLAQEVMGAINNPDAKDAAKILNNSKLEGAFQIGGRQSDFAFLTQDKPSDLVSAVKTLRETIKRIGDDTSLVTRAVPIAYTLKDIKTMQPVPFTFTASYDLRECVKVP